MTDFPTFPAITPPDAAASVASSGLGRLDGIGAWFAGCRGADSSTDLNDVRLLIVAGQHGAATRESAISSLSEDLVAELRRDLDSGESSVARTAQLLGVSVSFFDANPEPTGEIDREDALTSDQVAEAVQRGMDIADSQVDEGAQLLLVGDAGRGLTTIAAGVIGSLCSIEPVKVVGWGSGITDNAWRTKTAIIRDAMYRVRDDKTVPQRVLAGIGGADLAVLTGLLAQAAVRRTPVIIDGVGVAAAALCAQLLAPGAAKWWVAASAGDEPAITPAFQALRLNPVLDLGISNGQGVGALLAYPLIRHAVESLK